MQKRKERTAQLSQKMEELDSEKKRLEKVLEGMQGMSEEELKNRVTLTGQRVKEAIKIKSSLEKCIRRLKEILNSSNVSYNELHEDSLLVLDDLDKYLDRLISAMAEMSQKLFSQL